MSDNITKTILTEKGLYVKCCEASDTSFCFTGDIITQRYCVQPFEKYFNFTVECISGVCVCVCFILGAIFRRVLHVLHWAAAEHFGPGCAPLPGSGPAEDLPAGLVLRHHRNRHQPAGSPAGVWNFNFGWFVSVLRWYFVESSPCSLVISYYFILIQTLSTWVDSRWF